MFSDEYKAMLALRSLLNGKRTEALTALELTQAIQECSLARSLVERGRLHLYIVRGLERKIIPPDIMLTQAIAEVKSAADLTMVALALRYGANKNLYVATPNVGQAHILVYTVTTMRALKRDQQLIITVLLILILLGSQSSLPAFDQGGTLSIKTPEPPVVDTSFLSEISDVFAPQSERKVVSVPIIPTLIGVGGAMPVVKIPGRETVSDWLRSQGLPALTEDPAQLLAALKPHTRLVLGTIIDRPDIALPPTPPASTTLRVTGGGVPNFEDVLAARATQILKVYPVIKGSRLTTLERGEAVGLILSVEAANADAFTHLTDQGLYVSYFTINRLILRLRAALREGDTTLMTELQIMLQGAIQRGTPLDLEQLAILSTTDEALAQNLLTIYRTPQWRKVCAGPQTLPLPDAMKTQAFALGLDPTMSKERICTDFRTFSEADVASLKNAAILRQRARVGADTSTISEFIMGSVPTVTCANRTALQDDPFEYNDATMTAYRNNEGLVFCFKSNQYEDLLAKPINPYNSEPLPETFQAKLRAHLDILKRLGINPNAPMSTSEAIDTLAQPDTVSDKESAYIVDTVLQAAKVAGIDPVKVRRLTSTQMNQVLAVIGMDRPELILSGPSGLTPNHQLITFARAAYYAIKEQPEQARLFINALRLQP